MTTEGDDSDEALASLAATGNDRAFERLVTRHKDGLYRLLRRYTGNADEAYEAVQEAFIAAWKAIRRYDANRPFGAWLKTIAINKVRDRWRRQTFRNLIFGSKTADETEALNAGDQSVLADDQLILTHEIKRLECAIARLPSHLKAPLLLTALDGCSHKEAAAILGVTAKTVETRIYRARKLLNEKLDNS